MFEKNFNITAFLFVVLALSTWLDLNGVWVELPLIVNEAPEGWALPSLLSFAVALSNTAPIIIMLLKAFFKGRLDERIFIYIEIIIGIVACGLMAQYWNKTHWFAGAQHSVLFVIFVFLLGTLDTTSTVTYSDYMKRYDGKLLNALFLGESLTALIPSILAVIQGVGGEAVCSANSTQPEYSKPRFSVQVYFWIFAAIILSSLIAFLILEWTNISQSYRTENYKTSDINQLCIQTETSSLLNLNLLSNSMSKYMYYYLLVIAYIVNLLLFGILPSIGTYVMLPYSQSAYYIASLVLPISSPLSVIIALVGKSRLQLSAIISLAFIATCLTVYVIVLAALSPCPPLHDTIGGAIIAIACYFTAELVYSYIRLVIANRVRQEYEREHGLFWLGAISQMGALSGSIPMYFLINNMHVFKSRQVCQSYC
ncbi:unnamed protein product [Rotaria magnacalcarata]|uniref:Riboflavin transporter n=1 Tax=Rotaria magnacalcarata TaxID=392030 RepID=A0A816GA22_9BILA|nr:unnamed protein product [Rotaria magnacalcarata]CAF1671138.1 unnamed protein product [Rotaria magnacalcarata]CAF2145469.1 unnamed protein product [Rotaria magnacalcarata]CAF2260958.1 unnamed protein product [Rotaria magnacalcarata]CAF3981283.1 unnamed protein product [Rotaria magnacalcarata]